MRFATDGIVVLDNDDEEVEEDGTAGGAPVNPTTRPTGPLVRDESLGTSKLPCGPRIGVPLDRTRSTDGGGPRGRWMLSNSFLARTSSLICASRSIELGIGLVFIAARTGGPVLSVLWLRGLASIDENDSEDVSSCLGRALDLRWIDTGCCPTVVVCVVVAIVGFSSGQRRVTQATTAQTAVSCSWSLST